MEVKIQITSAAVSDRGLSEKRPQNEDSFLDLPESGLFAVADGVGGAQAGEVASQMAMEILAEAFINLQEDGDAEKRMELAIERANSAIFQMSNDLAQLSSMATTVVALHVNGSIATIGHVGDSRLYRLDAEGNLYRETLDHSVVEEEVRAGRMTPAQAAVHPSRNVISRALGAEPLVEIDLKTMMIDANTVFLACSDGVTRHIEDHELRELLLGAPDNHHFCETIKSICYERGAEDNLTAVVVRLEAAYSGEFVSTARETGDLEEETVASARVAFADDETGQVLGETDDEAPAEALQEGSDAPDSDPDEIVEPSVAEEGADKISIQASKGDNYLSILSSDDEISEGSEMNEIGSENRSRTGIFARIFTGLLLLLVGVAIGAGGLYLSGWMSAPRPQAQIVPEPIALTTFEQTKSKVVADPASAIETLSANPQNSEDHYFLALAYLLTKNYDQASNSLNLATVKLSDFDEDQQKELSREITLLKAVIDNPSARKTFEEGLAAPSVQEGANADGNSNIQENSPF